MIFKTILTALFSLFLVEAVHAQTEQVIPIYNSKVLVGNTLEISSDSGTLALTAYKANVIKLTFEIQKATNATFIDSVATPLNIRATQNLDEIFFSTDSLWVVISKFDLSVRFLKKHNEELLLKSASFFLNNIEKSFSFELRKDEKLQVVDLKRWEDIDLSSKGKKLRQKRNVCKPVIFSAAGYALYFKNSTNKKVQLVTKDHQFKVNGSFYPKSFFFLSGDLNEIEEGLKGLN